MDENSEAHDSARETEEQFRILVQGVTDYAIFMLSPTGVVTSWNVGAERIKGYRRSEIVGEHFSRFYTDEDKAAGLPAKILATARRQKAGLNAKDGECARTAAASGRTS
ncbi:PAS domain S-box-containing protein [Paraburkholderia youngii]